MNRVHTFDQRGELEVDEHEPDPVPCPTCGNPIDVELHYGIYVNRVAYLSFCSRFCATVADLSELLR